MDILRQLLKGFVAPACVLAALLYGLPTSAAPSDSKAEFRKDGDIATSSAHISLGKSGLITLATNAGDTYSIHMSFSWKKTGRWFPSNQLVDATLKIDEQTKTVRYRAFLPQSADAAGTPAADERIPVELDLAMTAEGKARISLHYNTESPIEKSLALANIHIHGARPALMGQTLEIDNKPFVLAAGQPNDRSMNVARGKLKSVVLCATEADRRIVLTPVTNGDVYVNDMNLKTRNPYVEVGFSPEKNHIIFDVELPAGAPQSQETYAGVDFYATGKLRMPQYNHSRNLVQNPSFEQGLRYWSESSIGKYSELRIEDHYLVDSENSHSGSSCLKILGEAHQSPACLSTFAIPVEPGSDYTFSFYARAPKPGVNLRISSVSAMWPVFPLGKSFPLTTEWQRYAATFKAPNGVVAIEFGVSDPAEDCVAYVDSVQLEKGSVATDYVQPKLGVAVRTQRLNNLFQPGEKIQAALEIAGSANARGEATLRVTDFYDREIAAGTYSFTLDRKGQATIQLPWTDKLVRGLYLIETNAKLADGASLREFGRITILPFLNNSHAHKNLFSMGTSNARQQAWHQRWRFWQNMGIGSAIHFDPEPHGYFKAMAECNALNYTSIFDGGNGFAGLNPNIKDHFHMTPEQMDMVEQKAYEKAKAYPEIKYWKLINEPSNSYVDNTDEMKTLIKVFERARKGILRATPDAKIISPDPANMYSSSGIKYVDMFYRAGGASVADIAAIHPYRPRPEEPDLDADTQMMISMLDRNKVSSELWFTEGIYHQNWIVPAYNLNTHRACSTDEYRGGPLSYDLGWGEKMCAAYTARSWLVGLKYADRVKVFVDWGYPRNSIYDINLTPTASVFASNTLGNILGNAKFLRDVKLGQDLHCYLFQDQLKRPVAVIWTSLMDVDLGRKQGPTLTLASVPAGMEVIDFTGKADPAASNEIAVSSFPVFLRGLPESAESLATAIADGHFSGANLATFRAYIGLKSSQQAEVHVQNAASKALTGKLRVLQDGKTVMDQDVSIATSDSLVAPIAITSGRGLNTAHFVFEFTPRGQQKATVVESDLDWLICHKMKSMPTPDGIMKNWESFEVPFPDRKIEFEPLFGAEAHKFTQKIPWAGPEDLSAQYYLGWNEQGLAVAVKVRDQIHSPANSIGTAWQGDSLQIYLDGWGDARSRVTKGFANDDQTFSVWPSPKGLEINRDVAPEQQLAFLRTGAVPAAGRAFIRTPDGYSIYQITFPVHDIQPVAMRKGTIFGFGILVNDKDDDYRKRALTFTPPGTEPNMRPDLLPLIILDD